MLGTRFRLVLPMKIFVALLCLVCLGLLALGKDKSPQIMMPDPAYPVGILGLDGPPHMIPGVPGVRKW